MICMYCGEPATNGHVCLKCKTQSVALLHKNANALEKLGSDLLYLILKTVDQSANIAVIHPEYLEFLVDRFEEFEPCDLKVCKDELIYELKEGVGYFENVNFLDDLYDLFEADTKVYQLIRSAYQEAKGDEVQ